MRSTDFIGQVVIFVPENPHESHMVPLSLVMVSLAETISFSRLPYNAYLGAFTLSPNGSTRTLVVDSDSNCLVSSAIRIDIKAARESEKISVEISGAISPWQNGVLGVWLGLLLER
jgi:hypothetical protein